MVDDKEKRWTDADMYNAYIAEGEGFGYGWGSWIKEYKKSQQKYTDEQIEWKIAGAFTWLKQLGIPESSISKTLCLAFLALCGIKPDMNWKEVTRTSMRMSKDIIQFAVDNYGLKEHSNNRDQFRREAINILLNYELIDMNPDNKSLGPNSPLTHYAVKQRVLNKIKQ